MTFLRKHTRVPSPEAVDQACESDLQIPLGNVGYILMEKQRFSLEVKKHRFDILYSSREAARAVVESYPAKIASGEIAAADPLDVYLVHRFRLNILGKWGEDILSEGNIFDEDSGDKDDHILINRAYNIVSIMDLEWCHTVSKEDAFFPPCMMWPVVEFYKGFNELSDDGLRFAGIFRERGRGDLAKCVAEGRKMRKFFFALRATNDCY
ncbi:hypothetical protein F4861DRAFT_539711 [Xylaria intraflava]|nr:hypothetical protein F4861DRAFT_539711 [Xylaria intraflava]